MQSLKELYKIGNGPSSSHTMGPKRAVEIFKNKNLDVIKYSLSIFEIIIDKKGIYFQETYAQSSNQTFSIKSLVHSIINLVNEFSGNYELLSMSLRILVNLSNIPKICS